MNDNVINEIKRLNFENILWVIFGILSFLRIVSNNYQKDYVISRQQYYEDKANDITIFILIGILFIYLYFFIRNFNMYNNKEKPTNEDLVKVIGSILFVGGTLCLLYFQIYSSDNFIDSSDM